MMNEYYTVLGLKPTANNAEIKKAYREMAKKYHPDLHPGDADTEKKFQFINEAYAVLSDPDKRSQYDKTQSEPHHFQETKRRKPGAAEKPDFSQMQAGFEQFFGFNPKTGEIKNEEKLKSKNPLDASDLFEKFMGMK